MRELKDCLNKTCHMNNSSYAFHCKDRRGLDVYNCANFSETIIDQVCIWSDKGYYYLPKCDETSGWRYQKEVHSKIKTGDICRMCGKPIKIKP
jgi:hypothetical protein